MTKSASFPRICRPAPLVHRGLSPHPLQSPLTVHTPEGAVYAGLWEGSRNSTAGPSKSGKTEEQGGRRSAHSSGRSQLTHTICGASRDGAIRGAAVLHRLAGCGQMRVGCDKSTNRRAGVAAASAVSLSDAGLLPGACRLSARAIPESAAWFGQRWGLGWSGMV